MNMKPLRLCCCSHDNDRRVDVEVDVEVAMSRWFVVMTCCDDIIHRRAWHIIYLTEMTGKE
jgi:hypothetical protein